MKKVICLVLTAALILTPTSAVFAKQSNKGGQSHQKVTKQQTVQQQTDKEQNNKAKEKQNSKGKEKKLEFKIKGSPVISYGRYKLPISPITKGMGAKVAYDKTTAVITVSKGTITIVIDLKNKTATVNGVADTNAGIFSAKNDKKMTVLIQYIAKVLGVKATVDKDKVTVVVPGLDYPANITVTPVGGSVVANTLNSTTLYMLASANITAGQATGGKAELYVGSKLVATDSTISATDKTITFTTADDTPSNAEVQAAVPTGGVVTVKLYNSKNDSVISKTSNPTLIVDYTAPTINGATSAVYSVSGSAITVAVTGAGIIGDRVDVTKLSLTDTAFAKTYQLTNAATTGSTGTVTGADTLTIQLGTADSLALAGFGTSTVVLNITSGALLKDDAGNVSTEAAAVWAVPVSVIH